MYAVIRRYNGVTDTQEAGRRVEDQFVEILREVPGFVAYYWVDAGDGVMLSFLGLSRRTGARKNRRKGAGEFVPANLEPLFPNQPPGHGWTRRSVRLGLRTKPRPFAWLIGEVRRST